MVWGCTYFPTDKRSLCICFIFANINNTTVKFIEHTGFHFYGLGPQEKDYWLLPDCFPERLLSNYFPEISTSSILRVLWSHIPKRNRCNTSSLFFARLLVKGSFHCYLNMHFPEYHQIWAIFCLLSFGLACLGTICFFMGLTNPFLLRC